MKKYLFKGVAAAIAVTMAVPSVPVHLQAATKLSVSDCVISKGDKLDLDIDGEKEKSGKYKTSKENIASVTKKGIITAQKKGKSKITWKKDGKKYTCKVKVVKAPTLSKSKLNITTEQKKEVSVKKYGNKQLKVTWSSSDKKIAKVNNGRITGVSEGEATIKAKIKGYKKIWTRKMKVTVKKDNSKTTPAPEVTKAPVSTQTPATPATTVAPMPTVPTVSAVPTPPVSASPAPTATQMPTQTPSTTASPAPTTATGGSGGGGYYPIISGGNSTVRPTASPIEETHKGYTLKWEEQFNGNSLNRDDWNVELHESGWVNSELQEYVDSEKNIYVKDGNLVLKPVKTVDSNGEPYYTSGRVNTQNKHNFKYGLFEARVKVPAGQGFLPAFWMMPADENLYGQWPRCGEIDIMEVLGNDTKTSYGTIHYGNPHNESQGKHTLQKGSFSDEYHVFSAEWEPGKINWYVDGILVHTEDDWYSATENQGEITYPAPFDQPFYIILNLAVGGAWPGNPDETTDIDNAAFMIDYVKVYQKDSYNENVEKPEKEVILRDPDADGNYVNNGKFQVAEDLSDDKDWKFLTTYGGEATAEIKNGEIVIHTTKNGNADYSVQLVQAGIPIKRGGKYRVTFDAYADEARTMKVGLSAPDRGYKRYFNDTTVELTTAKKTYEYDFEMTDTDDANGRLEYNLGAAKSMASVHISNVSIKKIGQKSEDELNKKTVRADGNYIYNGGFQEGKDRKGYWEITNDIGAEVSVTNTDNIRKLKVVMPSTASADKPVLVSQTGIELPVNEYALSFKAEGEASKSIKVRIAGEEYTAELTGKEEDYNYKFNVEDISRAASINTSIVFEFDKPGTYYLDDVRLVEDSLIKNGSFDAGLTGYEVYVDASAAASCVVDSLTENNAADFTIDNTGDAAWKIQLKQNNIELKKDQWYKLSLKAKSSIARKIMFAIQRDGTSDNDWTPYSGEKIIDLGNEYQTYDITFQMKNETDLKSVLSISMGAVGGKQITDKHRVCIDNINLEEIEKPEVNIPAMPAGENLLKNADFSNGIEGWENVIANDKGAVATSSFKDGEAVYNIENVGTEDWNVQLKQAGITLEKGCKYRITFKATSTEARTIKCNMLTEKYDWYGGSDIVLEKNKEKDVVIDFNVEKDTDTNITMVISMGQIKNNDGSNINTPASTITLSELSLVKVGSESDVPATSAKPTETQKPVETQKPTETPEPTENTNMLKNGNFSQGEESWESYIGTGECSDVKATTSFEDGKAVYNIENVGTEDHHVQLKQAGITLEKGCKYKITFTAHSTAARTIKLDMLDEKNDYKWYGGANIELAESEDKNVQIEFTVGEDKETNNNITMVISMGKIRKKDENGNNIKDENDNDVYIDTPASTITLSDFSLVKVE